MTAFDQGSVKETTLGLTADRYTSYWTVPANASHTTVHVQLDNTDEVGVIKFEGTNDKTLALGPVTPLPFEETDGTLDTDGYDVASGTDVNAVFVLPNRLQHCRLWYDYTSGGHADRTMTVVIRHTRNR